jgi:hypothetical protein
MKIEKIFIEDKFIFIEKDVEYYTLIPKNKNKESETCECGYVTWACKYPICKKGK